MRRDYTSLEDALRYGEGIERPFKCHMHDDSNASASVNVDKGVWYCFSCSAAGRVENRSAALTVDMKNVVEVLSGAPVPVYGQSWLDIFDIDGTHPYWLDRFGDEIAKNWRLGVHPVTGAATYPVHGPDGAVHGVVQRFNDGPIKYIYPSGVPISRMLFGFHKRRINTVLVVEGAADAISVTRAIGNKHILTVGCYGAGIHAPQIELIKGLDPKEVLLGFDDDPAGQRAKRKEYPFSCTVKRITWEAKDPGELRDNQIRDAINQAK